jgi:hypothetical protein
MNIRLPLGLAKQKLNKVQVLDHLFFYNHDQNKIFKMKKLITVFAVFLITASQTSLANDEVLIPAKVKSSFETTYGNTTNAKWQKIKGSYVARFTKSGNDFEVYYSKAGELLAHSRFIPESYLPQLIADAISTQFAGFDITELLEFTSHKTGTTYFIHLESNNMEFYAHAYSDVKIEILKRIKK